MREFGLAIAVVAALASTVAAEPTRPTLPMFVHRTLGVKTYWGATVDLDGDGRPETVIYAADDDFCGSGGCTLFVLTPRRTGYRIVGRTTITRPPIRVLATASHGWRDLGVLVCGGGIVDCYTARLRFDGQRYPGNPTVPPATRLRQPTGRILIDRQRSP